MKKLFMVIPSVLLLCFALSCQQPAEEGITEEEAKSIGDIYTKSRNEINLALLDEIYSPDVVVHDCSAPEDIIGLDALKAYYSNTHQAIPDLNATIDEIIIDGDKIVWTWTFMGTQSGVFHTPLGDIPPTGNKVKFSGVAIDRLEEGKIVEEWVYFNLLDVLMQLGFTLNPPQSPETQEEGSQIN
ncbi:MAG: ester cyclase [Candidatus Aminicenantes bacterium]